MDDATAFKFGAVTFLGVAEVGATFVGSTIGDFLHPAVTAGFVARLCNEVAALVKTFHARNTHQHVEVVHEGVVKLLGFPARNGGNLFASDGPVPCFGGNSSGPGFVPLGFTVEDVGINRVDLFLKFVDGCGLVAEAVVVPEQVDEMDLSVHQLTCGSFSFAWETLFSASASQFGGRCCYAVGIKQ